MRFERIPRRDEDVSAFRYGVDPEPDWFKALEQEGCVTRLVLTSMPPIPAVEIRKLVGTGSIRVQKGWWITLSVYGELEYLKPEEFELIYRPRVEYGVSEPPAKNDDLLERYWKSFI